MDYSKLSHDELIEKCKEFGLNYLTKQKKPNAVKTLISLLKKHNQQPDIKTTYEENYTSLELIIDKCHNFLYTKGITGSKAQNDIMKFFTIFIINHLHNTEYILKLIKDYKKNNKVLKIFYENYEGDLTKVEEKQLNIIKNHIFYLDYLKDISLILNPENRNNKGDENDMWKMFVQECLSKIFPDIYSPEDYILNCKYKFVISNLIEIISKFTISSLVIDEVQSFNGDIHEKFLKYQGNKNSKELGQFFTPREVIKSILNDCGFKKIIEDLEETGLSIYDPCLGTGGLLCYTYNACKSKIKPETIYGCEIEGDTMKLGIVSLMFSTNNCNKNIKRCNSLIENPYLFEDTKFDIIFTNPPFGTKNDYNQLEKDFEDFKKNKYPESSLKFKDIYKISGNTGINLFIQNIIYLLKNGGVACVILPDGELMIGKSSINIRKFILDNCRIIKIITINAGSFANTNIKTKALIIQKGNYDNYNQEIEYININSNGIENLGFEKLNENLQFNITKIEEEKTYGDDVELIEFGKIFKLIKGSIQSSKVIENEDGEGVMITLSKNKNDYKKIRNWKIDGDNLFIGNIDSGRKFVVNFYEGKCDYTNLLSLCKLNDESNKDKISIKYIYYYLLSVNEILTEKYLKGTPNKSLDVDNFNKMKIPIPTIEKQEIIVKFIDSLNDIINDNKKKIEKNKIINDLYLNINLIKCEIKTLGEICNFKNGKAIKKESIIEGEYPVIGGGQKPIGFHNKYNCDENTILCSSSGYAGFISKYNKKIWASDCFSIIPKNNIINNSYLYYFMKNIQNNIYKLQTGTAQQHIYSKNLEDLKIPIPSMEKQKEIIEYCDFNDEVIKNLEKEIEFSKNKIDDFFKQIL
jgi:type I restriction-modification system DNA methylase subunit